MAMPELPPSGHPTEPLSTHPPELLPQAIYEQLPRLDEDAQRDWDQRALVKFYVLDDLYWSFYVSGRDNQGDLFGVEVAPDSFTFATFPLREFEQVNANLDIQIKRDETFAPKTLREIVEGYLAQKSRTDAEPAAPVSREHLPQTLFLVDYSLSSSLPIQASAEAEAGEQAFALLHRLIGQAGFLGVTPRLAEQVQLGHAEIMIDDVEPAPPGHEIPKTSPGFFEISSVSRSDLEACGFDASHVSDADMELLASKMADAYGRQLFWSSLTRIAESLGFPRLMPISASEFPPEYLDARHSYAAYIFDNADIRKHDVAAVIEEAGRLGYPVRYWWLSQAMDLGDRPERLIVCVHHPVIGEHAGLDLYEKLKELQIEWDDLDAATVEEYLLLSHPITEKGIAWPDGRVLFPSDPSQEA